VAVDASKVAGAQALLAKFRPWFDKYRGGMTAGLMAAIMQHESGGKFVAGDASLGEVGYFQVASYVPPLFGYPAEARNDPESNVAIASLEYALEAVKWYLRYPQYVRLGTRDSWELARLAFAIGRAGSYSLAAAADKLGYLQPGQVYAGIQKYIAANGAPALGSQSSSKVAARVASIPDQFDLAEYIDGGFTAGYGKPTIIPAPPAGPYKIPADVAPYFVEPLPGIVLLALGAGSALLYYLWKRSR